MGIGIKIKLFRNDKKITQKKLAELIGVQTRTLQRYEADLSTPKYDVLQKISDALEIPFQCFLSIDELLEQQKPFVLSLPISQRLKVFRLCAEYTIEDLAQSMTMEMYKVYDTLRGSYVDVSDEEFQAGFESILSDLKFAESGYRELNKEYIPKLAFILNVPAELLTDNKAQEDNNVTERIPARIIEQRLSELKQLVIQKWEENDTSIKKPELLAYNEKLNSIGKQKLLEYAQDLASMEKYTKTDPEE